MESVKLSRRQFKGLAAAAAVGTIAGVANGRRADAANRRATFVLVHGAWHGGWCYERVAERLRAKGHRVFTPTLTGLGERAHLQAYPVTNCSTHIQDIVNVFKWERLTNVVLVGHSYGGTVIGGVADKISDKISSIVYLDAVIPEDGKSMLDIIDTPEQVLYLTGIVAGHNGQFLPPFPAEAFNVNEKDRALVDSLCVQQSWATFNEKLKLSGAYKTIKKKTYIQATNWKGTPFGALYAKVKDDPSWSATQVPSGHDVMLDMPDKLVELLEQAA